MLREKMKTSSCLERLTVSPAGPCMEELRYREWKMLGSRTGVTSNSLWLYRPCSDLQTGRVWAGSRHMKVIFFPQLDRTLFGLFLA